MSKLEAVGSAQEQIAELQTRLADLEEENRRLKMSPDILAAGVGFAERSSILFRSGVYEWDEVADQCTACSAGLAALFERPADRVKETLGSSESLLQCLHPDDRPHYGRLLNQMRLRNSPFEVEYRLLTADGKTIFVREVREPVHDEYGRLVQSRGFVCDVTEARLAREKQTRAEQHFQHFAASATHFLWEMGPDHRFSYVSDGIRWITGEDPDEFIGKTRRELANTQTINAVTLEANLEVMERQEPFAGIVVERPRASGGTVHLSISGSPLYGDTGEFLGYRGTAYDVTDSTTTMQALRQSRIRAGRDIGNWSKDRFREFSLQSTGSRFLPIRPAPKPSALPIRMRSWRWTRSKTCFMRRIGPKFGLWAKPALARIYCQHGTGCGA